MSDVNLTKKPEPRSEVLGDGEKYEFAPPSLYLLAKFEEEIIAAGPTNSFFRNVASKPFNTMLIAMHIRMHPAHPKVSKEDIGKLVDTEESYAIAQELMEELLNKLMGDKAKTATTNKDALKMVEDLTKD